MSSETKSDTVPATIIENCSLILVDVAGTTTPIDFVQKTLFPYALEHVEAYLKSNWDSDEVKQCISEMKQGDVELDVASATELAKSHTVDDNKGFKRLQGLVYKKGYEDATLKGKVFEDVAATFTAWSAKEKKIAVFSSGSVESQKLLFAHTESGDLTGKISNYFDQENAGSKTEAESYKKIAAATGVAAEKIVYINDNVDEATAAKTANLGVLIVCREGNAEIPAEKSAGFTLIKSFKELVPEGTAEETKKRKEPEDAADGAEEAPPVKMTKTEEETVKEAEKTPLPEEPMDVDPLEETKEEVKVKEPENGVGTEKSADKVETERVEMETETVEKETDKVEKEIKTVNKETQKVEKVTEKVEKVTEKAEKATEKVEKVTEKAEKATEKAEKETEKEEKETKKAEKETEKVEKVADKIEEKAETVEKETEKAEETEKKEEAEKVKKVVSETVKETSVAEEAKPEEPETKTAQKETEPIKTDETEKSEDDKSIEKKDEVEPMEVDGKKKEEDKKKETVEKAVENGAEEKNVEEAEDEKKPEENGSSTNGAGEEAAPPKVAEEKENKSVLANGKSEPAEATVETVTEEAEQAKQEEETTKTDETDLKAKKVEGTAPEAVTVEA